MTTPNLKDRLYAPTGVVSWPVILVEGPEKVGKTWTSLALSASAKVGTTYVVPLGEVVPHEYAAIPGARFQFVAHDGTWNDLFSIVEQIRDEARRAADAGESPVVLVVDSMTAEWDLLKDWAADRAKNSQANQAKLRKDPHAEVSVPMNLWNDAKARHRRLMTILMTFPGIVVLTARGKEVAAIDDKGQPVSGSREYKVEGEKNLIFDVSVHVRLSRDSEPTVMAARSVHAGIRPGIDQPQPMKDFTLERLIFEALRCSTGTTSAQEFTPLNGEDAGERANEYRDQAVDPKSTYLDLRRLHGTVKEADLLGAVVVNEQGDEEVLGGLIMRLGLAARDREQKAAPAGESA